MAARASNGLTGRSVMSASWDELDLGYLEPLPPAPEAGPKPTPNVPGPGARKRVRDERGSVHFSHALGRDCPGTAPQGRLPGESLPARPDVPRGGGVVPAARAGGGP